ncbi:MAG: Cof-type HAD-IIB family hydrolase [Bacilli bacterium]|nr:Cof-type HAD-IIB family hydrolase [Bacilli bacterium]
MGNKKLIAVDVDGTIAIDGKLPSPFTSATLRKINSLGHVVLLSSGRPYRNIEPIYREIGCTGPIVCYNGALVYHPGDPSFPRLEYTFSGKDVREIFFAGKDFLKSFTCETADALYDVYGDLYLDGFFPRKGIEMRLGELPKDDEILYTCLMKCEKSHNDELSKICESHPGIKWRDWGNVPYSELYRDGAHKGSALRYVMEELGIPKEDVIAFGDSSNDVEMLREAGLGFAMDNAIYAPMREEFRVTKKGAAENGVALELIDLLGL